MQLFNINRGEDENNNNILRYIITYFATPIETPNWIIW